jgi:hypothetical protein
MNLPQLHQAELDPATLDQYFADLVACAQIHAVLPRAAARTPVAAAEGVSLDEGRQGLRSGALRGVQIRYRYENRDWCDTLVARPGGAARIVRICEDEVRLSAAAD